MNDPLALIKPRRAITGISAVLLPFSASGEIDWPGFEATISATVAHVRTEARTHGLVDIVDGAFVRACQDAAPSRRTVCATPTTAAVRRA